MSVENIVSALRCDNRGNADCKLCEYCKINDEFEVWGCDEDKIKQLAADQLERIQLENERLKAEKPVRCGECLFWKEEFCGVGYCTYCDIQLDHSEDGFCSYGERRGAE